MKITREDRNNALKALDNAIVVGMKIFYACPDEDAAMIWNALRGLDDLQQYIEKAEIIDKHT